MKKTRPQTHPDPRKVWRQSVKCEVHPNKSPLQLFVIAFREKSGLILRAGEVQLLMKEIFGLSEVPSQYDDA